MRRALRGIRCSARRRTTCRHVGSGIRPCRRTGKGCSGRCVGALLRGCFRCKWWAVARMTQEAEWHVDGKSGRCGLLVAAGGVLSGGLRSGGQSDFRPVRRGGGVWSLVCRQSPAIAGRWHPVKNELGRLGEDHASFAWFKPSDQAELPLRTANRIPRQPETVRRTKF